MNMKRSSLQHLISSSHPAWRLVSRATLTIPHCHPISLLRFYRRLVVATALALAGFAEPAAAHPMGNFSINHYARFTTDGARLILRYVLDMAEIPTVTEQRALDANHDGKIDQAESAVYARKMAGQLQSSLALQIDGVAAKSELTAPGVELRPGAGGLQTLRLAFTLTAALPSSSSGEWKIEYHDTNYAERAGWKEIVATDGSGMSIIDSSAASADSSHELTTYPTDPTLAPPQQIEASFTLRRTHAASPVSTVPTTTRQPNTGYPLGDATPGTLMVTNPAASSPISPLHPTPYTLHPTRSRTPQDGFTQSISHQKLTPGVVLISLALALLFGAFHALSPGHGKAMVAAYLVGARGTVRHAAFLGAVITLTHTISVYILGLLTLVAAQYVVPERLYPVLSIGSGIAIVAVGVTLLWKRIGAWLEERSEGGIEGWDEGTATPPLPENAAVSLKSLVVLGVTGGALPCPSALVVMLGAIALHRIAFGMALIAAFSLGLAAVLTGIGLLVVHLRHVLDRLPLHDRVTARLPILSAALVTLVGVALIVRALHGQF
jgi:nickel/cobalt exporter